MKMNILISSAVLFCTFQSILSEEVRLLDLEPPDAQQYIDKQDTTLKYAPKIESNVPAVRFLGNQPHNVVEDIYLANQYHGQDGLGGYLYGYSVPDIAKTEKKKAGGDLRGAYNYIAGNGQEIKVEYWDDGTGFHQIDNVPKILPKQIDDTPEVKAAKEEHQRIWNEQAERNSRPVVDPNVGYVQQQYQQTQQQYHQPQQQYQGQPQQLVNQYQQQKQQYPNPGQSVHYQGEQGQQTQTVGQYQRPGGQSSASQQASAQYSAGLQGSGQYASGQQGGQYPTGQQGGQYPTGQQGGGQLSAGQQGSGQYSGGQQAGGQYSGGEQAGGQYSGGQQAGGQYAGGQQYGQYSGDQQGKYNEEEEEKGPPKGFFYNFDYPVGIIVQKDGGAVQKRESDVKDVYSVNKANFEKQLQQGSLEGSRSASGYLFIKK